jgi:hypothetical protein
MMDNIVELSPLLFAPSTCIISGPSSSGKSSIIKSLLNNHKEVFTTPLTAVLYCYGEDDDNFMSTLDQKLITPFKGMPSLSEVSDFISLYQGNHVLCCFDDLGNEFMANEDNYKLFTQISHHRNTSMFLVLHQIFYKSKISRLITLSTQFIILTRNYRDPSSVSYIGRQLFPHKSHLLMKVYEDAMESPSIHTHEEPLPKALLLSLHPLMTNRKYMLFSDFLPPGGSKVVYQI